MVVFCLILIFRIKLRFTMKSVLIWAIVVILSLIAFCWDHLSYHYNNNPLSVALAGFQGEIHCNTLKLQQLGFTRWAIWMSYAVTFSVILTYSAIVLILSVWILMRRNRRNPDSSEVGLQVDIGTTIEEPIQGTGDLAEMEEESNAELTNSWAPTSESCFEEINADEFDTSSNVLDEAGTHKTTNSKPNDDVMFSSELRVDLDVTKNRQKRIAKFDKYRRGLHSLIGLEIFTSHFYMYIHDMTDRFPKSIELLKDLVQ